MVVTGKIKNPLSAEEAEKIIDILSTLPISEIDLSLVKSAIETQKGYRISYRASLIIAAAERAGCDKVTSEDFGDGQRYNHVLVENPLHHRDNDPTHQNLV